MSPLPAGQLFIAMTAPRTASSSASADDPALFGSLPKTRWIPAFVGMTAEKATENTKGASRRPSSSIKRA
jgi:hypothetical protein